MKRLGLTLTLCLLFSKSAYSTDADIENYCLELTKLSRAVMTSRQYGASIEDALTARDRGFEKSKNEHARKIHSLLILDAYKTPAYSTESFRQSEIDEFAAGNYVACMQGMSLANERSKSN